MNDDSGFAAPPFTMVVSGAFRIVLRAISGGLPAFTVDRTIATLGGVPCNISAVSDDGAWAVLDGPTSFELCGSVVQDCGYTPLTLSNAANASGATCWRRSSLPSFLPWCCGRRSRPCCNY